MAYVHQKRFGCFGCYILGELAYNLLVSSIPTGTMKESFNAMDQTIYIDFEQHPEGDFVYIALFPASAFRNLLTLECKHHVSRMHIQLLKE